MDYQLVLMLAPLAAAVLILLRVQGIRGLARWVAGHWSKQ